MKIESSEINYSTYGRCVRVTNGEIELVATVDMGPYVMRYGYVGGDNVFFEDPEGTVQKDLSGTPFGSRTWHVYGGHRLWPSPEKFPRTYYPDDEKCECEIKENGAILTAPIQSWNQLQMTLDITMDESGDVTVKHFVKNCNSFPVTLAAWGITAVAPHGVAVFPVNKRNTGFFPNKWLCCWQYTPFNDERIYAGRDFVTLKYRQGLGEAKIGLLCEDAWGAYFVNDIAFIKRCEFEMGAAYPDNGCNCESYTCERYSELETLGKMTTIDYGESATHTEKWSLRRASTPGADDEAAIAKAVEAVL